MGWLYAREAPADASVKSCHNPQCAQALPIKTFYRCEECFPDLLYCLGCINQRHTTLPFHRIRSWIPGETAHFQRVHPADRNFALNLGHGGKKCPLAVRVKNMHFMHTNGMHTLPTNFCGCGKRDHWKQLLDHDLFPATEDRPGKVYSFEVLRLFHAFNIISKIAPQDFHQALVRLSDGAFPDDVPVSGVLIPAPLHHAYISSGHVSAIWSRRETVEDSAIDETRWCLEPSTTRSRRTRPPLRGLP